MKNFNFNIILLTIFLGFGKANACVYPEHRDIMLLAISKLLTFLTATLNGLWAQARIGYEFRLTESPIDLQQFTLPEKLDYADWTPSFIIIENTDFEAGWFGFNVRYVFGK